MSGFQSVLLHLQVFWWPHKEVGVLHTFAFEDHCLSCKGMFSEENGCRDGDKLDHEVGISV